ncbi:ubiquitin-conjugating enzyme [Lentinula raphanica]|uniref:E2 ubiquitin-conjugating enzyme n=1 Tax=Lentinula raphanica TaxID=153919 RepID=A0AA38PII9_9AGAR|nr:ubiquitin-conjugating enzyme [Lentinula raphanica]
MSRSNRGGTSLSERKFFPTYQACRFVPLLLPLAHLRPSSTIAMSKPSTPSNSNTLLLRRQLTELTKHPVEGFSAGLVDENNLYEWEVLVIGPPDTLYEGGFFKARLTFPPEFPLLPPKMKFITPMWHPNIYPDGVVCVSILHAPGDDQYGYEDAGERWMPVHTVESILISVISLLSSDSPNLDSPANVDAAKEVRTDLEGYKKKVRRLVRRSAEEAFD